MTDATFCVYLSYTIIILHKTKIYGMAEWGLMPHSVMPCGKCIWQLANTYTSAAIVTP